MSSYRNQYVPNPFKYAFLFPCWPIAGKGKYFHNFFMLHYIKIFIIIWFLKEYDLVYNVSLLLSRQTEYLG